MNIFKRTVIGVVAMATGVLGLSACSAYQAKAFPSQCIYLLQHGWGDAHHLKDIVYPGQRENAANDSLKYVYCNARNFLVGQSGGDEPTPITVRTKTGVNGDQGTAVNLQLSMYWQLNQDKTALTAFLPFCEKYNCFSSSSSVSDTGAHSSSAGWNSMLAENFPGALQRASITAAQTFDAQLPNEQGNWSKFGDAVAANFMKEIATAVGSGNTPYFCGSGSKAGTCAPVVVQVNDITFANAAAQDLANTSSNLAQQDAIAKQQAQVNTDTLAAAKDKYGDSAGTVLGTIDTINACKAAGTTCIVTLGGNTTPAIQVPTN